MGWKGKILWQKGRGKEDRSKCKLVFDMQEFHSFPALFSGIKKNENAQLTQNTIKHLATEYHPFSQKKVPFLLASRLAYLPLVMLAG